MCVNFDKYMAIKEEPLLIMDEVKPKDCELRFVVNVRKGGTNWAKFTRETNKKKMGKNFTAVPLIIPYTLMDNDKQWTKGCVSWSDAITKRRTTQLAYLTMFERYLLDINDCCATKRIRYPDSHLFILIKIQADDSSDYPFQVVKNLTNLLRKLTDGKSIERWSDEYANNGPNEFRETYNNIAKVFRTIEKKHKATFKFEAEKL